jgi:4-hydroxybenzoate polyprenyltransferase
MTTDVESMSDRQSPSFLLPLAALLVITFGALSIMWITQLGVASFGAFVGFAVYFLLVHVYLPYRVYVDARSRGSSTAAGWAAATFLVPILVALVYFLFFSSDRGEG